MIENETCSRLDLAGCVLSVAERRMLLRWSLHLIIAIGIAESVKIERPNIKSRFVQRVSP